MTRKILVVEDNLDTLEILQTALKSKGYEVLTASDTVQAFHTYRAQLPDVVVTDYRLGLLTSEMLIDVIREHDKSIGRRALILLTSSLPFGESRWKRMGVDGFYHKSRKGYRDDIVKRLEEDA